MMDKLSTVLVEPGSHCDVTSDGDLEITLGASSDASKRSGVSTELDMIQLSIFSHRFMSIAEQVCPLTHDIFFLVSAKNILLPWRHIYNCINENLRKQIC